MVALQFKYSASQEHQLAAVDAVCDLFRGQEFMSSQFTVATLNPEWDSPVIAGYANSLRVSAGQLEENLHLVQEENALPRTTVLTDNRLRDFTVEMETGTGKTYVYIRTIYELNRRYGLTKFVIVVPSVAIREGVKKTFESTREHFGQLYNRKPLEFFVYDSANLGPVSNFATSPAIQVMIINIGAFNKEVAADEKKGVTNIFHRPSEKLAGGRSAQELVSSCNPIVIIDEPQSVDNTDKAKSAINTLHPLFVLRYSATHREAYNKLYQLGPVEAFQQNLVKGIVVDSVVSEEDLNGAYVRLDSTDERNGYKAKLTIDMRQAGGGQKRKTVTVKTGDDLFLKSRENSDYENGWIISNIGTALGDEFVEFQNGQYLEPGEVLGDVASEAIKRAQIVRTIENHLEAQLRLYRQGIKVLSLFFIDKVGKYRQYEPEVHNGEYADIFEAEYTRLVANKKWQNRYAKAGVPLMNDAKTVHQGYFAQDRNGKFKDTREGAGAKADTSAFELIMQKKETLISFPDGVDSDKNVAFIFSHSALKEGWDNPNVFQICTLVETADTLTKRQKIGRGLRLAVNQRGERCYDPDVNVLTVIANESYKAFADGLQSEFEREGFRFGVLTAESFTRIQFQNPDGDDQKLGFDQSQAVFTAFQEAGLVDKKGAITPQLKEQAEAGTVELPAVLDELGDQAVAQVKAEVEAIILHRAQKLQIRDKAKQVLVELDKDVSADPAFQELWNRIRQTTRFEMHIDTDLLVEKAVEGISHMSRIRPLEVVSVRAGLEVGEMGVNIRKKKDIFDQDTPEEDLSLSVVSTDVQRVYDLPDPIAELQDAVGLTRATLRRILVECGRFAEFEVDPVTFLAQVAAKIEAAKAEVVSQGIKYTKLPESQWYTMDILAVDDLSAYLDQNAWQPPSRGKSLYSYVVYDSATVEKPYAVALDQAEHVKVFAKLPAKFKIDTPLGGYNPDWAYVEEVDGRERVYFVVETKGGGNANPTLRLTEKAKIDCARQHFKALNHDDVEYTIETTYHHEVSIR